MLGVRATAARHAPPWLPIAALGYGAAAVVAIPQGTVPLRTYAGVSTSAHILDLTAGLALVAAGSVAWIQPRLRRTALLAMLAGVAWFAPDWEGWEGGPTIVRSLGAAAPPLFLALVFHLALGFPSGRVGGRPARLAVVAVYTAAGVVSVGWALLRDPFADPVCWRYCGANAFLVHADAGLALGLRDFWLRAAVAIGVLLATVAGLRVYRAEQGEWRRLLPVLGPAAFLGLAEAAYAAALLHTRFENPRVGQFESAFLVRSLAATAVAFGVGRSVLDARRARTAVSRLAAELGAAPPPGTLAE